MFKHKKLINNSLEIEFFNQPFELLFEIIKLYKSENWQLTAKDFLKDINFPDLSFLPEAPNFFVQIGYQENPEKAIKFLENEAYNIKGLYIFLVGYEWQIFDSNPNFLKSSGGLRYIARSSKKEDKIFKVLPKYYTLTDLVQAKSIKFYSLSIKI